MAKAYVAEAVWRVIDRSLQLTGAGDGVTGDLPLARFLGEVRLFRIYDGPSETHRGDRRPRAAAAERETVLVAPGWVVASSEAGPVRRLGQIAIGFLPSTGTRSASRIRCTHRVEGGGDGELDSLGVVEMTLELGDHLVGDGAVDDRVGQRERGALLGVERVRGCRHISSRRPGSR